MRTLYAIVFYMAMGHAYSQVVHQLVMTGDEFDPDTLYMAVGDSIHLYFEETGHSMVQVGEDSWVNEVPSPLIGFAMGDGTLNVGDIHKFVMDSVGTFYYLCLQHPDEKGLIIVGATSIREMAIPGFNVYPQPASEVLFFDHNGSYASFEVIDHQGRPIRNGARSERTGLDVSSLSAGVYFITLMDVDGTPVAREKFIISR